jgi:hypothetical protein
MGDLSPLVPQLLRQPDEIAVPLGQTRYAQSAGMINMHLLSLSLSPA